VTRIETIGNATLYLGDCRDVLPSIRNIDAIVTDPPYGLGKKLSGGTWGTKGLGPSWDQAPIDFLPSILGLADKIVIWGGNYFCLPPSRGWLIWWKPNANKSAADAELAWTSIDANTRLLRHTIGSNFEKSGHPTQKPVRVMEWSMQQIKATGKVVDPFMGSGTSGVAAINSSLEFVGIEIEMEYFDMACRRLEQAYKQQRLFV